MYIQKGAPRKDSDQHSHPHSLIRLFIGRSAEPTTQCSFMQAAKADQTVRMR